MKKKPKKPEALKSMNRDLDCISAKFIKHQNVCIKIEAWSGFVYLTEKEAFKLFEWLKEATEYLEAKEKE